MKYSLRILACLTATVCTAAALAQSQNQLPGSASKPVAFVYVSDSTDIYAFAASSSGKLTRVSGSPFKGSGESTTINQKHLYAAGDDGGHIYGYAIADNGALKLASVINADKYYPHSCGQTGNLQSDRTGATVYNQVSPAECDEPNFIQAFKVDQAGELQYEGLADARTLPYPQALPLRFAAGDKYAYQTVCGDTPGGSIQPLTEVFKRESDGLLTPEGYDDLAPKSKNPHLVYCSEDLAASKDGNLAFGLRQYDDMGNLGPLVLATYKVGEDGKLSTESTYANMPTAATTYIFSMSLAPSAKLLAVGGLGFQVFHFNGSSPITPFSKLLLPGVDVTQFFWDRANHLYLVGDQSLYVYTVTPTSIVEAPDSPYAFPSIYSLALMPLD